MPTNSWRLYSYGNIRKDNTDSSDDEESHISKESDKDRTPHPVRDVAINHASNVSPTQESLTSTSSASSSVGCSSSASTTSGASTPALQQLLRKEIAGDVITYGDGVRDLKRNKQHLALFCNNELFQMIKWVGGKLQPNETIFNIVKHELRYSKNANSDASFGRHWAGKGGYRELIVTTIRNWRSSVDNAIRGVLEGTILSEACENLVAS